MHRSCFILLVFMFMQDTGMNEIKLQVITNRSVSVKINLKRDKIDIIVILQADRTFISQKGPKLLTLYT